MVTRGSRIGVAVVTMIVMLTVALAGCDGGDTTKGQHTMDVDTMRRDATADVRSIAERLQLSFSDLTLTVENCSDDDAGDSYRASVNGFYTGTASVAESRQAIERWAAMLRTDGWSTDDTASTHSGIALAKSDTTVTLYETDPRAVSPAPPNFELLGACHDLSDADQDELRTSGGDSQDILGAVR